MNASPLDRLATAFSTHHREIENRSPDLYDAILDVLAAWQVKL